MKVITSDTAEHATLEMGRFEYVLTLPADEFSDLAAAILRVALARV